MRLHSSLSSISLLLTNLVMYLLVRETHGGHALHASSFQILQLWENEDKIIKVVRSVAGSLENISSVLTRYLASWESISEAQDGLNTIGGDPASIFALLRHVAEGWQEVDDTLSRTKQLISELKHLATRPDRELLPNSDDVTSASEALAKLSHFYRFNSSSLAKGLIQSTTRIDQQDDGPSFAPYTYSLSVRDLADIGIAAVNKGYFDVGVEFLRAAKKRASSFVLPMPGGQTLDSATDTALPLQQVEALLTTAVKVHNHVLDIRGPRSLTHTTASIPYSNLGHEVRLLDVNKEPDNEQPVLGGGYLSRHDNKTWMIKYRALTEQQQIERLCRGEDLRSNHVKSSLTCGYVTGASPWLRIMPFKMEVVSLDPNIVMIYGVVTARESADIKEQARNEIHTPHHQLVNEKLNGSDSDWTLKHAWLETKAVSTLQVLSRRLFHIAGVDLDDRTSEPFMVANYGLGGEYQAHRDTHGPLKSAPNLVIGDRLATIVTYLEAPRAGGRLVFPWVGVGIDGVEGASVIWWNLLASHEHDFLTRHAACPILRGHKWIANKWVGYNAQWNTQPCPIDPSKKITLGDRL